MLSLGASLQRASVLAEADEANIKALLANGRSLISTFDDLLDYSHLEAKSLKIKVKRANLQALIKRATAQWREAADDKGVVLQLRMTEDAPIDVKIDAGRVRQILSNLLSHAIDRTPSGGVIIAVGVDIPPGSDDAELCISVTEGRPAPDPSELSGLISSLDSFDGSLPQERFGLAVSRKIARALGGDVETDLYGGRIRLTLRLAAKLVRRAALASDGAPSTARPVSKADRSARILVAEDNHVNQKVLAALLKSFPYDLYFVSNGALAVDALKTEAFDLVLMDLQMPEMDGLQATRVIRSASAPWAATPIIAMTANAMDEHREACFAAGMTDFVSKPIDARTLFVAIAAALDAVAEADAYSDRARPSA